mmetsp:Transcript_15475/g.18058  ORF Transcript_15475/g.18058 Transcript_15475/m.18058 type:complete len:334 (+) Transcript_15475:59-1060(+)
MSLLLPTEKNPGPLENSRVRLGKRFRLLRHQVSRRFQGKAKSSSCQTLLSLTLVLTFLLLFILLSSQLTKIYTASIRGVSALEPQVRGFLDENIQKKSFSCSWSYDQKVKAAWESLECENACSTGKRQSPIDVISSNSQACEQGNRFRTKYVQTPLSFRYGRNEFTPSFELVDDVNALGIEFGESFYRLDQFHFHSPSEHSIDSRQGDLELHLVHRSASDSSKLVVVAVFLVVGKQESKFFDQVLDQVESTSRLMKKSTRVVLGLLDVDASGPFWQYQGSLTTPPCSETVSWIVLEREHVISEQQLNLYRKYFKLNTNRETQSINSRAISYCE